MRSETHSMASTLPAPEGTPRDFARVLIRLLWIVPGVSVACVVLFLAIGHVRFSETGNVLVGCLIYCGLIATPSAALLTFLSYRCSKRFPRLVILINAVALAIIATCGTYVGAFLIQLIGLVGPGEYWVEFHRSYPVSIIVSLAVGLTITSLEILRHKLQLATLELRTQQVEQERAYKLVAEARLSSLESRIHPHFLFNTLNSISSLIPSNPQLAEDTVGKLASLLRFSLNANQSGLVLLSQELKIVRDYLEIERTRFGPRLRYAISAPEEVQNAKVPPLALQSLVENSIKHVAAQRSDGATIEISASVAAGHVRLEVADDGPGFSLSAISPQHGLGNLIARLELLFGDQGNLDVTRKDNKTVVSLSFPVT